MTPPRANTVELSAGTVAYDDVGSGPPVVFVHGLLQDADVWGPVVSRLRGSFRCITPDWPLGSHRIPMRPDADLTPLGQARLVRELIEVLGLDDVTVVAHDGGGILGQLLTTEPPDALSRMVIGPCDTFENCPPRLFLWMCWLTRVPGGLAAMAHLGRLAVVRRSPLAYGWVSKRGVDDDLTAQWLEPLRRSAGVRRDVDKFLRTVQDTDLVSASAHYAAFDRPVLVAWAEQRRVFPLSEGQRLAGAYPTVELVTIADAATYICIDQPDWFAEQIEKFVARTS